MKILKLLLLGVFLPTLAWTQDPINTPIEDDMGIVEDRFQELFFSNSVQTVFSAATRLREQKRIENG